MDGRMNGKGWTGMEGDGWRDGWRDGGGWRVMEGGWMEGWRSKMLTTSC